MIEQAQVRGTILENFSSWKKAEAVETTIDCHEDKWLVLRQGRRVKIGCVVQMASSKREGAAENPEENGQLVSSPGALWSLHVQREAIFLSGRLLQ